MYMATFAENRRAFFDYKVLDRIEAGIELKGFEVKSVVGGRVNLSGSYATIQKGELWIINLDIPPYQPDNTPKDYDPKRTRRLLVKSSEISELVGKTKEKGLTLVPLRMYNRRNKVKVEIGIGKSKKKSDKRETIRKREIEKEIKRFSK